MAFFAMFFYDPSQVFRLLKLIRGANAGLDELFDESFLGNLQSEGVLLKEHPKLVGFIRVFEATAPTFLIRNRVIVAVKEVDQSFVLE